MRVRQRAAQAYDQLPHGTVRRFASIGDQELADELARCAEQLEDARRQAAEIDLRAPQVPVVWVQAPDPLEFAAYWSASGDLDGDGRIDAIPNGMAGDGPANRRDNAGEAHVVSGLALAQYLPGEAVTVVGETAAVPGGAVVSRLSQSL